MIVLPQLEMIVRDASCVELIIALQLIHAELSARKRRFTAERLKAMELVPQLEISR